MRSKPTKKILKYYSKYLTFYVTRSDVSAAKIKLEDLQVEGITPASTKDKQHVKKLQCLHKRCCNLICCP